MAAAPKAEPKPPVQASGTDGAEAAPKPDAPRIVSIGPAASSAKAPATSRRQSRLRRCAGWCPRSQYEIADKTSLLDLNDRICRWPMGIRANPISILRRGGEPTSPIASSIAAAPIRRNFRAARAACPRPALLAGPVR
ncbi:hypothetical protein OVY29_04805 [Sphingopyxis sp. SE2]|nr:hypothetical protein [Sphingopyxis sp. SE2]